MNSFETNDNEKSFGELLEGEGSLSKLSPGNTAKGTILGYNDTEVFVHLGFKYDGVLPISEFSSVPGFNAANDLKKDDVIDVFVVRIDDKEGKVYLSKKKLDMAKDFAILEQAYKDEKPVKVVVTREVKGGVISKAGSYEIFIPASQISERFMKDFTQFIGKQLDIKLIEYNPEKRRFVGSAKVLAAAKRQEAEERIFAEIEPGKHYKGIVKSMTDFGVFVDIGGVEGLVHISELSWSKLRHPSQVLKVGDEIDVFVIEFNPEKKKISLGYKRAEDNPWADIESRFPQDSVVYGKVVRITPYGAFVELAPGVDGLLHISNISTERINRVEDVLRPGDEIEARVIEVNIRDKRISLSTKEAPPRPYDDTPPDDDAGQE